MGCQIKWQIQSRVNGHKYPHYGENKWAIWGKNLPSLEKHYDLAISYMNGFPNYYVIDKVNADKRFCGFIMNLKRWDMIMTLKRLIIKSG